jgi:hypothetical protein
MAPISKQGSLLCEVWLAFVRRMTCAFCDAPAPSQPHHFPPKGRGTTDDSKTVPVCARCHMRCHGQRVEGKGSIPEEEQRAAVAGVRSLFLERASDAEFKQYASDRRRWAESRVFTELVPE